MCRNQNDKNREGSKRNCGSVTPGLINTEHFVCVQHAGGERGAGGHCK